MSQIGSRQRLALLLRWLRPRGGLIGAAGALVVFFSWVWSANVEEGRAQAFEEFRAASEDRERAIAWAGLARDINAAQADAVRARIDVMALHDSLDRLRANLIGSSSPEEEAWGMNLGAWRREAEIDLYAVKGLSVDLWLSNCERLRAPIEADPGGSETEGELGAICERMRRIRDHGRPLIEAARAANSRLGGSEDENAQLEGDIQPRLAEHSRVLLGFEEGLEKFHAATGRRLEELSRRTQEAERDAERARKISILFYALGTLLAVAGAFLKDALPDGPRAKA